jgi:glycyl-tRNA synthetase beta chain
VRELSMKVNQKYFSLRDAAGQPAPYFGFVANLAAPDGGAAIIAGNERVLRARLADARHFWDLDLKTPLEALLPKLEAITFHAKLGTQRARAERISYLAKQIAMQLGADGHEAQQAHYAGLLAKADLVTGMVGEFPELQGVMGGYYAAHGATGWDGTVVGPAIKTHYQPKGPSDAVPTGRVAVSVALADKIDTLREFFRIGETPTGSGDPYALRRAALGVVRIILENDLRLRLKELIDWNDKLFEFIIERLRVKLRGEGKRYDVLDAVLAAEADDDLVRIMKRVDALSVMLVTDDGQNLLVAYRRAANILKIEDAKDGPHINKIIICHCKEKADIDLDEALGAVKSAVFYGSDERPAFFDVEDYENAMRMLSSLRPNIDTFFEDITVNTEPPELRQSRLGLLASFRDTIHRIADFSKIEG